MSNEKMDQNKTNFSFNSLLIGLLIGVGIYYLSSKVFSEPGLDNIDEIIAAVPDSIQGSKSTYILKAVQFNARIQDEIDSYNNSNRISREFQDQLTGYKRECPDDTIKGVNFELIPIISSILEGQDKASIQDLILENYGVFVAFGKYPNASEIVLPQSMVPNNYTDDYEGRRTVFINYTKTENDGSISYLNDNSDVRLGDNLGKVCPRYCPQ